MSLLQQGKNQITEVFKNAIWVGERGILFYFPVFILPALLMTLEELSTAWHQILGQTLHQHSFWNERRVQPICLVAERLIHLHD